MSGSLVAMGESFGSAGVLSGIYRGPVTVSGTCEVLLDPRPLRRMKVLDAHLHHVVGDPQHVERGLCQRSAGAAGARWMTFSIHVPTHVHLGFAARIFGAAHTPREMRSSSAASQRSGSCFLVKVMGPCGRQGRGRCSGPSTFPTAAS